MKKEIWTSASSWGVTGAAYERFSEHFADALFHCAQRLAPRPGESLLDVATGTGWTARIAAARGAHVTGIDYSEEMIVAARKIAQHRGLTITFDVGDAHQLPYPDNSFDAIISTFGVIFASQPEVVARELARICRPGGRLALAVWSSDCTLGSLAREVLSVYNPPLTGPPPPSPYTWGSEVRMKELLEPSFELQFEQGCTVLREPDGESVWRLWKETHGLTVTRIKALDSESQDAFRAAFIEFHEHYRTELGIAMPRDYIIAVGTRR